MSVNKRRKLGKVISNTMLNSEQNIFTMCCSASGWESQHPDVALHGSYCPVLSCSGGLGTRSHTSGPQPLRLDQTG